ncbi:ring-1,2-phenylacetyl-CoA epoxidase subunit PaaD [Pedococcus dokdonensis]|uniref:Ring-1,2-phenylacetyl-CoA epoxidase subunit PaaD n=1 Tax=Pedococcus dokdonensis TaxID=443156 RepID=A0A1H0V4A2_9MICO|nr:1,2-phenylacetyl-CoA epoxidase subunit PaaD [Pedococcus dokdonensis]SDP73369.1 ring-1,2-phenylacetyl-CoA epoxidase subunit PaaD [Pedococcus dokdonensis]
MTATTTATTATTATTRVPRRAQASHPSGPKPAPAADPETTREQALAVARRVTDPEMPMLTLEDLGVLRGVAVSEDGAVTVTITPTYSGCPAMATMRDDLVRSLGEAGLAATVRVALSPAWSSDWITDRGRRALADHGLSAPGPAPARSGPVALSLLPTRRSLHCPRCGSGDVELTSEFGATSCKALYRCTSCLEPFEHVKEI